MPRTRERHPKLRVIGRSEILLEPIRERAKRDLGFDIEFELIDGMEGLQRVVTQPGSFDVYHQWHTIELIWTARSVQAIDLRRILHGDEIKSRAHAGRGNGRLIETVFDQLFLQPDGKSMPFRDAVAKVAKPTAGSNQNSGNMR